MVRLNEKEKEQETNQESWIKDMREAGWERERKIGVRRRRRERKLGWVKWWAKKWSFILKMCTSSRGASSPHGGVCVWQF